jgi:hypothetical protein
MHLKKLELNVADPQDRCLRRKVSANIRWEERQERSMMTPPRIFAILDLVIQSESKVREIWELYTWHLFVWSIDLGSPGLLLVACWNRFWADDLPRAHPALTSAQLVTQQPKQNSKFSNSALVTYMDWTLCTSWHWPIANLVKWVCRIMYD